MERIAIIGYSGHAYVVLDACKKANINIQYYCDKNEKEVNPYLLDFMGDESSSNFNWDKIETFVLGIGDNEIRQKVVKLILSKGKTIKSVVHPTAIINDFVSFGEGTIVAANAVLNPFAEVGDFCILNTRCIIEHECKVSDFTHIAPGVVLAGNVSIGKSTFVGANSVIKEGLKIGGNVIIGAGSVVLGDVPDNQTWVGNPAKRIK